MALQPMAVEFDAYGEPVMITDFRPYGWAKANGMEAAI